MGNGLRGSVIYEYVQGQQTSEGDHLENEQDIGRKGQPVLARQMSSVIHWPPKQREHLDEIEGSSNDTQDFARSLMEPPDDPATNLRPNKIDPIRPLHDDFSTLTAIYSGVVPLRNKVKSVSDADGITAQQKLETASAAFYAEQHIRSLCESFDDPISGISVTPDNYVVVKVSLHERSHVTCQMAVAPTGQCAMQLEVQRRPITVNVASPWPHSTIGQMTREFLEDATGPRQMNGETEAHRQPPGQPA